MHEWTDRLPGGVMSAQDEALEREFEERLLDSSTLAFRVAFSVLRHREDAEDVAQDAFARAHKRFRQLRERDRFRSWLVRLVWRLALDRRRSDKRRAAREDAHGALQPAVTGDGTAARERADAMWAAIDALPEKLRSVIVLASIEGHDVAEVAALLRIPPGTVKSRLFLARQRLKEDLQWLKNDSTIR
jgi:RNA polymerase sigma-70 factor (ECF subfamily)